MKTFEICVFFALFAGTLASPSNYTEIANDELDLEWYKSAIYFTHKGPKSNKSANGIIPMYQKISNYSAFYGIFQYNRNKFAAEVAVNMFKAALASVNPNKIDSKSFLEKELKNIDNRLMQGDMNGELAESETKALVAILGPNMLNIAEVGDMGKSLFKTDRKFFKESLLPVKLENPGLLNVLGGKAAKAKNPDIHGDAVVIPLSVMKWIVLGTKRLESLSENQIKQIITKNAKNLTKAAQEVTNLIQLPKEETDSGVIVIDGHPMTHGEQGVFCINMGCFRMPG